jgi:hypothetical protein
MVRHFRDCLHIMVGSEVSLPDEPPRTARYSLFATENHLELLYMVARLVRGPGTVLGDASISSKTAVL